MKTIGIIPQAVSVEEFKRAVHIMADDADDDVLFASNLAGAQEVVETYTRRALTVRDLVIEARAVGWQRWWVPVCPVVALTGLSVQTENGTWLQLEHTALRLEAADDEPQLVFPGGFWSGAPEGAAVRFSFDAGHAAVPQSLKQAIILLAKDWYEAGIAVEKKEFLDVSFGCRALMKQWRYARPREFGAC